MTTGETGRWVFRICFSPAYKADVTGSNVVSFHVGVAGSPAAAGSTRATHSAPLVRSSGLTATTVVGARGQRGLCSAGLAYAAAKATRALSIASPASLPKSIRATAGVTRVGLGLAPLAHSAGPLPASAGGVRPEDAWGGGLRSSAGLHATAVAGASRVPVRSGLIKDSPVYSAWSLCASANRSRFEHDLASGKRSHTAGLSATSIARTSGAPPRSVYTRPGWLALSADSAMPPGGWS